jgi:hypothetical protein
MSRRASGTGAVTPAEATDLLQVVVGATLSVLVVGLTSVHLPFDADVAVTLEGPIRTDSGSGTASDPVDPHSVPGLALLQPLLGAQVGAATAHEGGALTLELGAVTLRCDGDLYYEPWSLTLADGRQLTSTPGGGFVVTE